MLTNVQPVPPAPTTTIITDASEIRAELEQAGIEVGPDPGKDGDWAARLVIDGEEHDLVAFGDKVRSVERGMMSIGRLVSIVDGRLVTEGASSTREAQTPSVDDRDEKTNVYIDPIIAACLIHADEKLGPGPWQGETDEQQQLAERLPQLREVLNSLPPGTIEAIGSTEAKDVNAFLAERGYDIALQQQAPPSIYVAAALDLLATWKEPGERATVWIESLHRRVPGVKMECGKYRVSGNVLQPDTHGTCRVYMVESDDLKTGLEAIRDALRCGDFTWGDYQHAEFPTVELDEEADISKVIGMRKADARISQAVARVKLRLDEIGAHAQAAAAMAVMRSMPRMFRIGGPFTIAFATDAGIAIAYHVTTEHFVAPTKPTSSSERPTEQRQRSTW